MSTPRIRRLAREDLDAVVAIDATILGRTRRAYFERRLAAALRSPDAHVQFAIEEAGALRGHVLGRFLDGEFGRGRPALRLEVVTTDASAHGRGLGRALHAAIEDEARRQGASELRTSADWRDHRMLGFLAAMGYRLAPATVLECAVAAGSTPDAGFEASLLAMKDLDDVVRIDRDVTGRDRTGFMRRALEEALRDSAIRVSLAARLERALAGFLMAHADLGDFGRAEPVAIVDTLGVDPALRGKGIGRALLGQLFAKLAALRIERVETVVSHDDAGLAAFFRAAGFAPGQRLEFDKPL